MKFCVVFFSYLAFIAAINAAKVYNNGEEYCKTRLIDFSSLVASRGRVEIKNVTNVIITTQLTQYLQDNIEILASKYNFFIDSSAKTYEFKGWHDLQEADDDDNNLPSELRKNTIHIALAADDVFPTPSMFATIRRILMCGKSKGQLNENYKIIGTGKHDCRDSIALNFSKLMKKYHVHTEGPIPEFQCVQNLSLKPEDSF